MEGIDGKIVFCDTYGETGVVMVERGPGSLACKGRRVVDIRVRARTEADAQPVKPLLAGSSASTGCHDGIGQCEH